VQPENLAARNVLRTAFFQDGKGSGQLPKRPLLAAATWSVSLVRHVAHRFARPQSSTWRGGLKQILPIRLIHAGRKARIARVDAVVFFLGFPFYRTYLELVFRVWGQHGFAE